jgi:glutathione synthase
LLFLFLFSLYKRVFNYFTIAKRTKVLNERLNFSLELISVIEASLNEKKHVRLEWIIIILICAEVFFNIIDHLDFFSRKRPNSSDDRS